MVPQQVQNILRHLKEVHNIEKHLVTEALLPKGTPPFPETDELLALRARVDMEHKDYETLESYNMLTRYTTNTLVTCTKVNYSPLT